VARIHKTLKWIAITFVILITIGALRLIWLYQEARIKPRFGCPLLVWVMPPDHSEIQSTDYIDLREGSAGPYMWEPIHIRIYANGLVERDTVETVRGDTFGCPLHPADRTLRISPEAAEGLLTRARDGGFCRLCAGYQYPSFIYDAGSEELTLSLHGKSKAVWNHEGEPPPLFGELIGSIYAISPMDNLADPAKFTAQRSAECEAFLEQNERSYRAQKH